MGVIGCVINGDLHTGGEKKKREEKESLLKRMKGWGFITDSQARYLTKDESDDVEGGDRGEERRGWSEALPFSCGPLPLMTLFAGGCVQVST